MRRREFLRAAGAAAAAATVPATAATTETPNIVLIMTDDQGWGQTGYYDHPQLKTPNLNAMAAAGLRCDRFYAGGPVCSPTRATVLTGRSHCRTGVMEHGYALRTQEKTLPAALKAAGYATGHFGKWHLNGLRGPGVPILKDDDHGPGGFGFDRWLSVTNFFDMNPVMGRSDGTVEEFTGDSSSIIVSAALTFIRAALDKKKPFFAVIWDGSPHRPFVASAADRKPFKKCPEHLGEIRAFDRSVGVLRRSLRELGVADNTIVWFCSDNGGLPDDPAAVGNLRGRKGSVWEGGLRVPGIIEWPAVVAPRVTKYPAATMDIFPTLADIVGLPASFMTAPVDGISLLPLLKESIAARKKPIPFRYRDRGALVDNHHKLVATGIKKETYALYDLAADPGETKDIAGEKPAVFARLKKTFREWNAAVEASIRGEDYPAGRVRDGEPKPHFWWADERYRPYLDEWIKRPEYRNRLKKHLKKSRKHRADTQK